MEIWQYWLEVAFASLTTLIAFMAKTIFKRFKTIKAEQLAQSKGIQALLRDRIIQAYYHYYDTKTITLHGLENINSMYLEYHNLGGNGTIKKLVEEMRKYEVVERREDEN